MNHKTRLDIALQVIKELEPQNLPLILPYSPHWLDHYIDNKICECGSDSCGQPKHSDWCPKFE